MEIENAHIDVPVWDYLYQGLQMGLNAWDLINISNRFCYTTLLHGLQSQYREMWTMGLKLIDGIQTVGNSFILDSVDLHPATSDRGEAGESEILALQSKDTKIETKNR
jgi:hypothetical protein